MRKAISKNGFTLNIVAGMHVVILGMDLKKEDCKGLMGFAIHRTDHDEEEAYWLKGMKTFEQTDPGFIAGSTYSTKQHPIQGFSWSDFTAKPGHNYTYRVQALKGKPKQLVVERELELTIKTESEEDGLHDIYFNRGASASQEYVRRFGNRQPDVNNPDDPRWEWLSRGLMEAIESFIKRAKDNKWGIRVAAYEFRLDYFANIIKAAKDRGVDVKVLYDANNNPPDKEGKIFPKDENEQTARKADIKSICQERITRDDVKRPPISHHKFIVLLNNNKAVAVLTGSTNFSMGGVYGQSNCVHIVEDKQIADNYLKCWNIIENNPYYKDLKKQFSQWNQIPEGKAPEGTTTIFSPQETLAALDWYSDRAMNAKNALFMTFAFGMNEVFKEVYNNSTASLRFALLDKLLPPGTRKNKRAAAEAEMLKIRKKIENRFSVGNLISTNNLDRWVRENLTGFNTHVQYIHTKFMLVEPLGNDPLVITGSANFSGASTDTNDENMLIIKGNKHVADIYLGEYMRLWNHYAFREWASSQKDIKNATFKHLDTESKWWESYFGNTAQSRQRQYFATGTINI
jgi:phosphatidylserine/phosphatidylglycerophosphate/cardiolipin synthase-like enzyme